MVVCFLQKSFKSGRLNMFIVIRYQGVSYSQKFGGKHSFPIFANSRTSQFMFPKYGIKYQNVKIDNKIKI